MCMHVAKRLKTRTIYDYAINKLKSMGISSFFAAILSACSGVCASDCAQEESDHSFTADTNDIKEQTSKEKRNVQD